VYHPGQEKRGASPEHLGSIEVCVEVIAALAAKEDGLRTAIGMMLIATPRTGLAGVPGANCDAGDSTLLHLVDGEGVQLGKRPTVKSAFALNVLVAFAASYLGGLADMHEILENEGCPGRGTSNEAFGEDMICISRSLFQVFQLLEKRKSLRFWKMDILFPAYARKASFQPFKQSVTRRRNLDVGSIDRLMTSVVKTTVESNAAIRISREQKYKLSLRRSWVDFAKQLIFFRCVVRFATHLLFFLVISLSVTPIIVSLNETLCRRLSPAANLMDLSTIRRQPNRKSTCPSSGIATQKDSAG
jgi:hypothetical protein